MLRSTWVLLAALMLLTASAERASAISFNRTLTASGTDDSNSTQFAPDRIQLFLTPGGNTTFSGTAPSVLFPVASGWTYSTSNGGYNATLEHNSAFSPAPGFPAAQWSQGFVQGSANQLAFTISWTLIARNWAAPGNPVQFVDTGGGTFVAAAPVAPEPSTLLILGLGAAGAAFQARRRRTTAAVPVSSVSD